MTQLSTRVPIVRVREGRRIQSEDVTAPEVPLELRLLGRAFTVMMRTPGADRDLVSGFLLGERIIRHADDIALIEHCTDPDAIGGSDRGNIIAVTLESEAAARAHRLLDCRRDVMANAACGVCGRSTIDSLESDLVALDRNVLRVASNVVTSLPARMRERQPIFTATGGLHAAGVFDVNGNALAIAEDVGRHNAVDKVTGSLLLRDALPLSECVLFVSGRTSYEIVQKAWCAGIPIVASVSAPSSLAVSLASRAGITLAGFVRDDGLNIYTGDWRIE
jgi:FdhD protein